jgi:hypothetical protein
MDVLAIEIVAIDEGLYGVGRSVSGLANLPQVFKKNSKNPKFGLAGLRN